MTFPHTATIHEMTQVGTKFTYGASGTTECFLQPLDAEASNQFGIVLSKGFACYLPYTSTVAEKTRLIIDGITYSVRGLQAHNYGSTKHKKAILELLV